jgi:transcription termination factor NusB
MIKETELRYTVNTLVELSRKLWGDNSTEFLAGALQSVITEKQMKALIDNLFESVSA